MPLQPLRRVGVHPLLGTPEPPDAYEEALTDHAVAFGVIALRPSVGEILRRMEVRGRLRDLDDLPRRRRENEHQVRLLESEAMRGRNVIDTTHLSVGRHLPNLPRATGSPLIRIPCGRGLQRSEDSVTRPGGARPLILSDGCQRDTQPGRRAAAPGKASGC